MPVIEGRKDSMTGTISTYINQGLWQTAIAYRISEWKYILTESLEKGYVLREEIYDLNNNPDETANLYGIGNKEAKDFELRAIEKIRQFKRLKSMQKIKNEKQRIRAKLKKIDSP